MKGRFSLIRTNRVGQDNQWLLIKANDEFVSDEDPSVDKPKSVLTGKTNAELGRKGAKRTDSKQVKQKTSSTVRRSNTLEKEYLNNIEKQFPTVVRPMLGTLVDNPFDNKDWVFEIKWDGVRAILFFSKKKQILELKSRNDKSITRRYPELLSPLEAAINCKESAIVDGEIVVIDEKGYPNFQSHQRMNECRLH